jgi:hypothetical protein
MHVSFNPFYEADFDDSDRSGNLASIMAATLRASRVVPHVKPSMVHSQLLITHYFEPVDHS